ncbi:sodium:solute symporter family protein [Prauserella muralis]|uniref:Pantothenate permease n=1 Tax=Prauserella muralis TaxID=588067 RepID=A0A2V4AT87_9PSEU|nr:sodium:solute symporter family protein [Prauserella muralis]PXY24640.1 pantothenate permease [Prauserella muralis]TWE27670.1 SSS family solute:Na+ symporter [Prauserella muralis]
MSAATIWWGIAIYVVFASVTAYLSRRGGHKSMSGYFLGSRNMGGWVSAMSYSATTYSAFMLIGLAGLAYQGGVGALGFELIYLCGVTLVLVFGPRFWRAGKTFGYITPSEMLGGRYESKALAVVTALASCLFLIPYAAVQLAGVGYLLQGMTGGAITFTSGAILATVLAIVFSLAAGLRSVAWTDSLQAIVMVITATAVVLIVVNRLGGFGAFFGTLQRDHPGMLSVPGTGFFTFSTFLGLTLPWVFFSISNPQVSQRLFTPRSMRDLRRMLLGFMVFGFIYTLVAILWGFAAAIRFPGLQTGDLATPTLLSSGLVPTVFGLLVMIGIVAAAVSTIDSILLTLSSMITRDVYATAGRTTPSDTRQLALGKLVIPVIAVLAYLFAQLQLDLIAILSVAASAGLLVMVPAIVGSFFWRRGTAAGALTSVLAGGAVVIYLEATSTTWLGQGTGVWALLVSLGLFVGVSLVTTAPREKAEQFLRITKTRPRHEQETGVSQPDQAS